MKKLFKILLLFSLVFLVAALSMLQFDVIWTSPPYYTVASYPDFEEPIMDMQAYNSISDSHARPYIYSVAGTGGGIVHVLGIVHSGNPNDPQMQAIRDQWTLANPTVALVESRLGFLFRWTQDPIAVYGERGLTADLAKKSGSALYTWEPDRQDEINVHLQTYPAEQLAMFYTLRPFFSYSPDYRRENGEHLLQLLLEERTDYDGLRNVFDSWEDIDRMLREDYPDLDWRAFTTGNGWPDGYLFDIWNSSNLFRDRHMVTAVVELVENGEQVFVTMGASHAPRIETTLKAALDW